MVYRALFTDQDTDFADVQIAKDLIISVESRFDHSYGQVTSGIDKYTSPKVQRKPIRTKDIRKVAAYSVESSLPHNPILWPDERLRNYILNLKFVIGGD
jgi:hypothetical protein